MRRLPGKDLFYREWNPRLGGHHGQVGELIKEHEK